MPKRLQLVAWREERLPGPDDVALADDFLDYKYMAEPLLKALDDPRQHKHIQKTVPAFFREWQGGFALINSVTTVDDCKKSVDSELLAGLLAGAEEAELVGRLLARSFVGPAGMQVLHRSMLELDHARFCKHAKERASLLIENVVLGAPRETEVVAELRADLGALLVASSLRADEDVPDCDDPERVDWWVDFLKARVFQWGQRYAVNQQCKLILEAISSAPADGDDEDQE